jgi:demethylmenaquinone methyltransferase/2-methoxy-6-polyprenyl-1,4-benzoquinol methylase
VKQPDWKTARNHMGGKEELNTSEDSSNERAIRDSAIRERKQRVQGMFNAIASRYDLLNHLLSAGIDLYWRRRALALVRGERPQRILDLATGTGDFAIAARRLEPRRVVGADVALNMLRLGSAKLGSQSRGSQNRGSAPVGSEIPLTLLCADAERLPFADDSFDLVTAAFGVRNFGDVAVGLEQARRVLKTGGELLVLEFTQPTAPVFSQLYRFYFKHILPVLGGIISGNRQAYAYLPESVAAFPQHDGFLKLMREAGFDRERVTSLTLGICAVYQGHKAD